MSQPSFIDDPEKGVLDTLTPLPVLPVSSKAVIQDAAVGLEASSFRRASLTMRKTQVTKKRCLRWRVQMRMNDLPARFVLLRMTTHFV